MENTTQSLSGALNNLIKAYEDLQKENIDLKVEIKELKGENAKLKDDLEKVSTTSTKQSQDIDGMVSKINSLLKSGESISADFTMKTQETKIEIEQKEEDESLVEISQPVNDNKTKIDLNKMESLLNGFGGNS